MRRGDRFIDDQAEVVFSDTFVEQLDALTQNEKVEVTVAVTRLCADPGGKHPLGASLAGWITLSVLGGHQRVVYRATSSPSMSETGVVEVLCLGPRSDSEVYDLAKSLVDTGLLSEEEETQIWEALSLLELSAKRAGLDDWDYRPPPAPDWLVASVVNQKIMEASIAKMMSKAELEAAMEAAYGDGSGIDPDAAISAALAQGRGSTSPLTQDQLAERSTDRCGKVMPRARVRCIRRHGHAGPCRAKA